MVYRRGTKLAGCRCAPKPPYDLTESPDLKQPAIRRVLAEGSAPMVYRRGTKAGGLSLRSEAALRSEGVAKSEAARDP
jgi:hypothetical protein